MISFHAISDKIIFKINIFLSQIKVDIDDGFGE